MEVAVMEDEGPLAGEELETWASLATVLEWLPAALDAQLQRDSGMSHFEYGLLFALADAPEGVLRMSRLAAYAQSSLTRLSRAVTRLEERGWVRRAPDPEDGRSTLAVLTAAGRRVQEDAAPGHARLVRDLVLGPLSAAQHRQLRAITGRIADAVQAGSAWRPGR
jgi:DNA-binding MarR family transcriptional regulator